MRRIKSMITYMGLAIALVLLGACGTGEPSVLEFELSVSDRQLSSSTSTFEAKQGDTVVFSLFSDEAVEFHLHGYDIKADVPAGGQGNMKVKAGATGQFQIVLHVGRGVVNDGHSSNGHGHDHEHDHGGESEEITVATLRVQPR